MRVLGLAGMAVSLMIAAPLSAQRIDYGSGNYQYPQTMDAALDDDVVTQTDAAVVTAEGDLRSDDGETVILVPRPVVQSVAQIDSEAAAGETLAGHDYGTPISVPTSPGGAARSIPARRAGQDPAPVTLSPVHAGTRYLMVTDPVPAGGQLVTFDRGAWLASCHERLATYPESARDAALAALGGAAMGYRQGVDRCETYLDSYIAAASASDIPAAGSTAPGQMYMLVPITVKQSGENRP